MTSVVVAKKIIRKIDDFLVGTLRSQKHIVFDGCCPMNFIVFKPFYDHLKKNRNLKVYFMNSSSDINFYKEFAVPGDLYMSRKKAMFHKWDVYITTDFFNHALKRKTKKVYIPHGMSDKKNVDRNDSYIVNEELLDFDRVFFPSQDSYNQFLRRFGNKAYKIAVFSGYQRLDYLCNNHFDTEKLKAHLNINNSLPVVLFAPTWGEYSTLNIFGPQFLEELAKLNANILIKLHDHLYSKNPNRKNKHDWEKIMKNFSRYANIRHLRKTDIYPYMKVSDCLISDYGSSIFEYQVLNKPTIYMSIEKHEQSVVGNPEMLELLKKACITITSPCEIEGAFKKAKDSYDFQHQYLQELKRKYFVDVGNASKTIVNHIYELLNIESYA